jgi:hypothetical protein
LEKEVAYSRGVGLVLALSAFALCSCQRTEHTLDQNLPERGFGGLGEASFQSLSLKRKNLAKEKKLLEMEFQWLVLRQKLVRSEIELRQAQEFENALALEMARYGEMEKRFPGEEGFIDPAQRRAWDARLIGRKQETEKAAARVRLLVRDMNDLIGKISHHGFIPPDGQSGQTSKPVAEQVVP